MTTTGFDIDKILEIAEQIERKSTAFYRRAAESCSDEATGRFLADLAVLEEGHEKTFSDMRKALGEEDARMKPFDPDDETARNLEVMADVLVFNATPNSPAHLTGEETLEEVIKKALLLEKDTIAYYIGIKDGVPENLGKNKIDAVIKEEMGHVSSLNEKLASLHKG